MKISHNGDEWHGTFGLTLTAMLSDLLSDGIDVGLRLTLEGDDGEVSQDVVATAITSDRLLTDVGPFELDTILAAEAL